MNNAKIDGKRFRESGGEGRDSNPRVVLATAAGKPAAALANGDLSSRLMPLKPRFPLRKIRGNSESSSSASIISMILEDQHASSKTTACAARSERSKTIVQPLLGEPPLIATPSRIAP